MALHTPLYLGFLLLVVVLCRALPSRRKAVLLVASYGFYASIDVRFPALLLLLTASTAFFGRRIAAGQRRGLNVWLGVGFSLAVLALFKYANFFLDTVQAMLAAVGVASTIPYLNLWLPVGISFYTFQAISYLAEIYHQRLQPQPLADVALYLAFFPKLIAGPLMRPQPLFAALNAPTPPLDSAHRGEALNLLALGLFKKFFIADQLTLLASTAFTAATYPDALGFPAPLYWQGFYLYAIQIYADFSGYTDLARGSALLLGITLPENFRRPYFAWSPVEFWNRWHVSLSLWIREYLFFPLSRRGLRLTKRRYPRAVQISTNLITMTAVGLWHGAAWNYIVWGFWHGLLISLVRPPKPQGAWRRGGLALLTFHLIGVGWVIFGAETLGAAGLMVRGLFSLNGWQWLPAYIVPVLVSGGLVLTIDLLQAGAFPRVGRLLYAGRPLLFTALLVAVAIILLFSAAQGNASRPFIYGQF